MADNANLEVVRSVSWSCSCGRFRFRSSRARPGIVLALVCRWCGDEALWSCSEPDADAGAGDAAA